MKNILLCNNAMGIGGVETVILNQVMAFTKKGYNVYVTAGKGIYSDKIEELVPRSANRNNNQQHIPMQNMNNNPFGNNV